MKKLRVLMVTLCVAVFLCGFSVTAHAGGGPVWEGLDPAEETTTPEPTIEPGEGFTEEGTLVTRDLLYDEHTNKQFITVQTSGGSTFYILDIMIPKKTGLAVLHTIRQKSSVPNPIHCHARLQGQRRVHA